MDKKAAWRTRRLSTNAPQLKAQGRPPVGKGHDAAGFRAVFAPGAAAVEGAAAAGLLAAGFLTIFFLQQL
jgi:hypothetical protein